MKLGHPVPNGWLQCLKYLSLAERRGVGERRGTAVYKELSVFTLSPPPDSSGSEEAPLPPIGLGFTWLVTIAATEVSGSSRGSRVPPLGRGRTGRHGAEPGRYPRQRDPRGGLHSHRPALPLARAGRWRKEVLALASGENSPARQGSPAPSALIPAEEPAKGCVSPPSLPTPPPPLLHPLTPPPPHPAEDNPLVGKREQGERVGAPEREGWSQASLPSAP